MIQAFRIIEISKYDDGGQLTTRGQLMQGSSRHCMHGAKLKRPPPPPPPPPEKKISTKLV